MLMHFHQEAIAAIAHSHRCPETPGPDGECANEFTIFTNVTRNDTDGIMRETSMCLPVPQYDVFTKAFWCVSGIFVMLFFLEQQALQVCRTRL